jgi:HEAT repeat protein
MMQTAARLSVLDGHAKELRVAAAHAFGSLGDPRALGALRARLRDPRRIHKSLQRAILSIALGWGPQQCAS